MFLRNVGWLSTDCTALYVRKHSSHIKEISPEKLTKDISICQGN
jgi:hypothetical protein